MQDKKDRISVSWSRLREWMTCHWRYRLSYEYNYTPIKLEEPLYYGSVFHQLMEYLYSETPTANPGYKRRNRKSIRAKLVRCGLKDEDLDQMLDWAMTYLDYMKRYKAHEPSTVVATEFPFVIDLSMDLLDEVQPMWRVSDSYSQVSFVGVMDLIVMRSKRPEIWDHKLQANHPRNTELDHPTISYPQMGIYSWASRQLGYPISYSVLNVFGKRRSSDNVQRYPIRVTDMEASMWGNWLYSKIAEMLCNPDRSKSLGSMYCSFCSFRYPCIKHMTDGVGGLERALEADFEFRDVSHRSSTRWRTKFSDSMVRKLGSESDT